MPYNFNGDTTPYGMPPWGINKVPFPKEFPTKSDFPYGLLLQCEAECLLNHARKKDLIVELGTFHGLSASIMSLVAKRVISVDVYHSYNGLWIEDVRFELSKYSNIQLVESDANEYAKLIQESPDLVFIDADHNYDSVKSNFENWLPKVKIGGEILFHDYQALHYDTVVKFISELFGRTDIVIVDKVGTIIAFKKVSDVL